MKHPLAVQVKEWNSTAKRRQSYQIFAISSEAREIGSLQLIVRPCHVLGMTQIADERDPTTRTNRDLPVVTVKVATDMPGLFAISTHYLGRKENIIQFLARLLVDISVVLVIMTTWWKPSD